MDVGFVTYYSPEIVEFAAKAGFDSLEVYVNRGSSLDLDRLTPEELNRAMDDIRSHGLRVSTLKCSTNHLVADRAIRASNNTYFLKALKLCRAFGTAIMTTNTWGDPSISPAENLKTYKPVFSEFAKAAESEGIVIAMENCPHGSSYPYTIGSIGYSPEMWDALFEAVPSRSVGLELDPSHLFWLGIDIPKAIRAYPDRIFAFHAKDCEIDADGLYRYGILGRQFGATSVWDTGWWRARLPGLGQIDWKEVFRALFDIDYSGPMIIEHEDPVFGGDRSEVGLKLGPRTEAGLRLGLHYLRRFMPDSI
ncbi:MAG: sugar phosphate isomerase/epimerase family protein [Spirochaetia bacterium]|jgi:sugar phosphate isomerase/epimerase